MDKVKVRPAKKEDIDDIARIHVKTWQCAYKGQIPQDYLDSLSVDRRKQKWAKIFKKKNQKQENYVAEIDGKVVGFSGVGYSRDNDTADEIGEVYALYVDPDFLGRGAGSALLEEGITWLKNKGYKRVTLWVLSTNEEAKGFYKHRGWVFDGKKKMDKQKDFSLDEMRYSKELI